MVWTFVKDGKKYQDCKADTRMETMIWEKKRKTNNELADDN